MSDAGRQAIDLPVVEGVDLNEYLSVSQWHLWAMGGLAAALVVWYAVRRIVRLLRRRRPAVLHPKLQEYGEGGTSADDALASQRRAEAAKIVATSSGGAIVGYQILEQVEAVFVDGFRRPEAALEGLKAVAAMKGANAVTNVRPERQPSGRFAASGDAVIARRLEQTTPPHADGDATNSKPA